MKITTIQISGFRKILKATINMEDDITVIAGANNSGKTSVVELFNYVFNAKGALCSDDFPVYESQEWCTAVFPYFQAQFKQENKKDDLIANILGTIVPSENPENEMLLTPIEVLIQVDYDPANDDIRNFADYIMELDPDNSSFYFIYRFELDKDLLRKSLDSEYEKLRNRFDKLVGDVDKDAEGIRIIKEMLIHMYTGSCKDAAYFSDKTYSNIVPMDLASFRALFNYQNIMAGRTLDDGNSDRARILSKNMIDIASQEENWKTLIQSLPDKIKQSIEDEQIQQEVRKASIETLGKTIEQISKTNGGQAGNITIDMVVTDEAVQSLLKSITSAKYAYIGEYYEEQSPTLTVELEKEVHQQIEKANPNTDTFTCPYIKRRKITLIKVLTADDTISPYLQSAIARNWHSLSDLNEYAELVLSGCFDTVLFKDKLTVTFRVKRKEEINVLDLANFVLCAARLLSDDKPETVQVKTTLHSPGDVILQIWNFAQENAFPLLICYMAIFGGKVGDYEFHSIIGVIKGIINHKYDEDKKKIELRKLSAEADLAEQQALKQKLENIETMRRLQLSSVDAYAEPLATAAKNLAVQPSSATIIDITKILKSQQEEQPPQ